MERNVRHRIMKYHREGKMKNIENCVHVTRIIVSSPLQLHNPLQRRGAGKANCLLQFNFWYWIRLNQFYIQFSVSSHFVTLRFNRSTVGGRAGEILTSPSRQRIQGGKSSKIIVIVLFLNCFTPSF